MGYALEKIVHGITPKGRHDKVLLLEAEVHLQKEVEKVKEEKGKEENRKVRVLKRPLLQNKGVRLRKELKTDPRALIT